ncbi:hypothetical protein [Streptomyces flavofungini]|uniref:hypothetical protein n=1 Tax=Streptomyces flavofungini TaxID=68200 RepID=UPI0025AEE9FC|nr:hypothetical protein [Streptomyces flavofungini]WJV50192.1 hypothetical protein QUY26_34550 [Streptomyces flavofungini]
MSGAFGAGRRVRGGADGGAVEVGGAGSAWVWGTRKKPRLSPGWSQSYVRSART